MKYIFDTSSLSTVFRHYYHDAFPSFWVLFDKMIAEETVVSVREVNNEIKKLSRKDALETWAKINTSYFHNPTIDELQFITQIYSVLHFRNSISQKELLKGNPLADPFVIAKAYIEKGTVVTQEDYKPKAAKIPNTCEHFEIPCLNLQGFLKQNNWSF